MTRCKDLLLGAALGSVLTAAVLAAGAGAVLDPVVVSPQLYTVRLDNDRVRVLEYRLAAGGKEPMHSHRPGVVVALGEATVRTTLPDGSASLHPSKAGEVFWRDAVTHSAENVGSTEAHYLSIELKDRAP